MAKKQKPLGDWQDTYPPEVIKRAEAYDAAHVAKSAALGELNTAKEKLIEAMKEHKCTKVRIRNGEKFVVLETADKVRIDKPKADENGSSYAADDDAEPALPPMTAADREALKPKPDPKPKAPPKAIGLQQQLCTDCGNRWDYDGETSDVCPRCESSFHIEIVGFAGDLNVNIMGVYVDGAEFIEVPIDAETKHTLDLEIVEGVDGRWRGGYTLIRSGRGGEEKSKPARVDDPGHVSRAAAIEATLGTAIDVLGKLDAGSAAGNSRRDFALDHVKAWLSAKGWEAAAK